MNKLVPAQLAAEHVAGCPALQTLLARSLILLDPPEHARLRSAAMQIWAHAPHGMLDAARTRTIAWLAGLPTGQPIDIAEMIGTPIARIVLEELLGTDVELIDALLQFAPYLNALFDADLGDEAPEAQAEAVLARTAQTLSRRAYLDGRLLHILARNPELGADDKAGLAVFIATAAIETTRALTAMCAAAAPAQPTIGQVLEWATPVPLIPYSIDGNELVVLHLQPTPRHGGAPFGLGRHYCVGAPLARCAGQATLDGLVHTQVGTSGNDLIWNLNGLSRSLTGQIVLTDRIRPG